MGQNNQNHKPKRPKSIGRGKNLLPSKQNWKKEAISSSTIIEKHNCGWFNKKIRKGGRIHDPTPPEKRRSSILKSTFPKKQPLRITFLILKRKQESENFSPEIFSNKGKNGILEDDIKTDQKLPCPNRTDEGLPKGRGRGRSEIQNSSLNPKRGKRPLFKKQRKTFRRPKEWEIPSHHFCSGHKPAAMEMQKKKLNSRKKKGRED